MTPGLTNSEPISSSEIQHILTAKTGADPQAFEGTDGLSLEEIGIDSLAVLELEAVVEDKYGLRLPEEALKMTINEIVAQINSQSSRI